MAELSANVSEGLQRALITLKQSYEHALFSPKEQRRKRGGLYCVCSTADETFAFPLADLVKVIRPKGMVQVPKAKSCIVGAQAFKQDVYTVFNLAQLVGCTPSNSEQTESFNNSWVLLLRNEKLRSALLVDELLGIHRASAEVEAAIQENANKVDLDTTMMIEDRSVTILHQTFLEQRLATYIQQDTSE